MKLPADILENICLRLISEYEPKGIKNLAYTLKNIIPLTLSCKKLHRVVYDTVYPRLNDMITSELSDGIPWDDIIRNPRSVKVKELQRANKSLGNSQSKQNKDYLSQKIFKTFEITGPLCVPANIIWQHNVVERMTYFHLDHKKRLIAESVIGTLFYMGVQDTLILKISGALSCHWKKKKMDTILNNIMIEYDILTMDQFHEKIDLLYHTYLPAQWNYENSRYYIEKVSNTKGCWTMSQIAMLELRKYNVELFE